MTIEEVTKNVMNAITEDVINKLSEHEAFQAWLVKRGKEVVEQAQEDMSDKEIIDAVLDSNQFDDAVDDRIAMKLDTDDLIDDLSQTSRWERAIGESVDAYLSDNMDDFIANVVDSDKLSARLKTFTNQSLGQMELEALEELIGNRIETRITQLLESTAFTMQVHRIIGELMDHLSNRMTRGLPQKPVEDDNQI